MAWWIWILIGLVLLGVEAGMPGGFFFLFFGISGLAVGTLAGLGIAGPPWVQWGLFSVLALLALALLRKPLQARLNVDGKHKAVDKLTGETATAQTEMAPDQIGQGRAAGHHLDGAERQRGRHRDRSTPQGRKSRGAHAVRASRVVQVSRRARHMLGLLIVAIVGFFILLWIFFKIVVVVPQQNAYVVERLGQVQRRARGRDPHPDPVHGRDPLPALLKEQAIDIPEQVCITRDNVQVGVDGILYLKIMDPERASYGITNYGFAITQLAQTTLRSEIGKIELDRPSRSAPTSTPRS